MRVLTTAQMREADRQTISDVGIPSSALMENAGRAVVEAMARQLPALEGRRVSIVAGKGNNGGDGLVAARELAARGSVVTVCLAASRDELSADADLFMTALEPTAVTVVEAPSLAAWEACREDVLACDVLVDALFGTGLTRPVEGYARTLIADLNLSGVPIVSIDLPSGLSADDVMPKGEAVEASLTVALGAPKVALLMPPAATQTGDLIVADIGIPDEVVDRLDGPECVATTREWARDQVSPRPDDTHKGDCGRVLVVAGAMGTTGAAGLAAMGALRSGAGLVTVATPRRCQSIVAGYAPEYMTVGLADTEDGMVHPSAVPDVSGARADVVVLGPGLGQSDEVTAFVRGVLDTTTAPLVLDADGLNAVGPGLLDVQHERPLVITPHPGEMSRLTRLSVEEVQTDRLEVARRVATGAGIFVVLKGARTVVATPAGRTWINTTGNPGMATGGTGDALAGVIAAWIAQTGDVEVACALGVFLHGLAGDEACARHGEVGMIASDLVAQLGPALVQLLSAEEDAE